MGVSLTPHVVPWFVQLADAGNPKDDEAVREFFLKYVAHLSCRIVTTFSFHRLFIPSPFSSVYGVSMAMLTSSSTCFIFHVALSSPAHSLTFLSDAGRRSFCCMAGRSRPRSAVWSSRPRPRSPHSRKRYVGLPRINVAWGILSHGELLNGGLSNGE